MKRHMTGRNNKGFSLVELIIVIAIMALLVAIIVPSLLQYINKAKKAVDITTAESIGEVFTTELVSNDDMYKWYNWHLKEFGNNHSPQKYRLLAYSYSGSNGNQIFEVKNNSGSSGVDTTVLNGIMQDICYGIRPLKFHQTNYLDYWWICTDQTGKIFVFVGAGGHNCWNIEQVNTTTKADVYKNDNGHSGRCFMIWPEVCETYEHAKTPTDCYR